MTEAKTVALLSLTTAQRFSPEHTFSCENRAYCELYWQGYTQLELYDKANVTHVEAKHTSWPHQAWIDEISPADIDVVVIPAQPSPFAEYWSLKQHTQYALNWLAKYKGRVVFLIQDPRPEYYGWQKHCTELAPNAFNISRYWPSHDFDNWLNALVKLKRELKVDCPKLWDCVFANFMTTAERKLLLYAYAPANTLIIGNPIEGYECLGRKSQAELAKLYCEAYTTILHVDSRFGAKLWPTTRMAEAIAYDCALLVPSKYEGLATNWMREAIIQPREKVGQDKINRIIESQRGLTK